MRPGILPGILAAIAVLLGLWLFESDWFYAVRLAASILAAIMIVFCIQGRRPTYFVSAALLAVIVTIWNPVIDLTTGLTTGSPTLGSAWMFIEIVAAAIMLWAGFTIKVSTAKK
jgi:hypothetical protein